VSLLSSSSTRSDPNPHIHIPLHLAFYCSAQSVHAPSPQQLHHVVLNSPIILMQGDPPPPSSANMNEARPTGAPSSSTSRVQGQHLATFPRIRASGRNDASRRARWTMYEVDSDRPGRNDASLLRPHTVGHRRSSLSNQLEMTPSGASSAPSSPQPATPGAGDSANISDSDGRVRLPSVLYPSLTLQPPPTSADYVIAVVGHEGVGKSTVIKRAIKTWGGSQAVKTRTNAGHLSTSFFGQRRA
jgi:hypothetical protein